jgi:hypothetical protein
MGRQWTIAVAVVLVVAAGVDAKTGARHDSARIVPWVSVGAARLGDAGTALDHVYGRPTSTRDLSRDIPFGTRWHGHHVVDRTYRVQGGSL